MPETYRASRLSNMFSEELVTDYLLQSTGINNNGINRINKRYEDDTALPASMRDGIQQMLHLTEYAMNMA